MGTVLMIQFPTEMVSRRTVPMILHDPEISPPTWEGQGVGF